ncbi:voltage-dependent anion channel-domain-containing protein [Armillaria luteobubalina]|uniref:Voltage-dependent anion channel-domain-containing protein n=1 Tax=Armillaria luteobubalina TaxID=153913 RepID=A0AA39QBS7_9AGAR|nr:voltage-dependent anion channel-domain-containing protein [Armillaria luteobubalina]
MSLDRVNETKKQGGVSSLARHIHGWSWQSFPIGMGTGAVFVTLSGLKEHPSWLYLGGNRVLVSGHGDFPVQRHYTVGPSIPTLIELGVSCRDPVEGLYPPMMVLQFATITIGVIDYTVINGPASPNVVYALFWAYVGLSLATCVPMLMIWFNRPHDISRFTPGYAFLVFPLMLTGVVAFNALRVIDPLDPRAFGILITGYFFQGLGFFMTFFYLGVYLLRLVMTGFMEGPQATGAFVACGPPGFTALSLINLADHASAILPAHGIISNAAGEIWYATSVMAALLLYGLAVFFFFLGVIPYWFKVNKRLDEILPCWALTFPNVGWIVTTGLLGQILNIQGLFIVHVVMDTLMFLTWSVLIVLTFAAIWKGLIFNAKDEDVLKISFLLWTRKLLLITTRILALWFELHCFLRYILDGFSRNACIYHALTHIHT